MSESIYYQNRGKINQALVDVIAPLVFQGEHNDSVTTVHTVPAWNSNYVLLGVEDTVEERDPGAFFTDERMSKHRREAVALAAGLAVVRRTIVINDLEAVGLKPFSSRYALGFLSRNTTAEFSAMSPEPIDAFLFRTTSGHNNTARYEALPLLDLLAEQAEERFPLLHDAIERFSR